MAEMSIHALTNLSVLGLKSGDIGVVDDQHPCLANILALGHAIVEPAPSGRRAKTEEPPVDSIPTEE